ncbi:MAG: hypothetical protein AB1489_03680 [Acidobacteriota bacterium]
MLISAHTVSGQNESVFQDPSGKYELRLPPNWQAVNYQDGAGNARVDIIYRDRAYGLLKITQESLSDNSDLDSLINNEIQQNLRFRPGYVYNSNERFVGEHARGQLLQFDFSQAGTPKKARHYYLKGNNVTVWVLRFTGNRDVFSPLRHETDQIARSFKPVK